MLCLVSVNVCLTLQPTDQTDRDECQMLSADDIDNEL